MDGTTICRKPSCSTRACCRDCAATLRSATQERSAPPVERRARAEAE